jgi:hypothetical protein
MTRGEYLDPAVQALVGSSRAAGPPARPWAVPFSLLGHSLGRLETRGGWIPLADPV